MFHKQLAHFKQGIKSSTARRFVLATILSSSILACFITAIQLYMQYQNDVSQLNADIDQIKKSWLPSLRKSLWSIDEELIRSQLQGILQFDGFEYVSVTTDDSTYEFGSKTGYMRSIAYSYELQREEFSRVWNLGTLEVIVSLDQIYRSLWRQLLTLLLSNTLKTTLVALIIIVIYQSMVGRYIAQLAKFATHYDLGQTQHQPILERNNRVEDEFSQVENAMHSFIANQHEQVEKHRVASTTIATQRDALEESNNQLAKVNEELTHFSYSTSHDLKAPMTSVLGFLKFAKKDIARNELDQAVEDIDLAVVELERLTHRIEDTLALARSELSENKWETIDIKALVKDVWQRVSQSYPQVIVSFRCQFSHSVIPKLVKVRIQIILENLFSNAIKYSSPERPIKKVWLQTENCENQFVIRVSDNGIGIAKEYHQRAFTVFQRFANSPYPSSGLGLAIARKNVEQMGGTIELESSKAGTTFKLCFEIVQPQR